MSFYIYSKQKYLYILQFKNHAHGPYELTHL